MVRTKVEFTVDGVTFHAIAPAGHERAGEIVAHPVRVVDLIVAGDTHALLLFGVLSQLTNLVEKIDAAQRTAAAMPSVEARLSEAFAALERAGLPIPDALRGLRKPPAGQEG